MKIIFIRLNMFEHIASDAMKPILFTIIRSLTPPEYDITFLDERAEPLPEQLDADIIAFSVETYTAKRAYILARKNRRPGTVIVMGFMFLMMVLFSGVDIRLWWGMVALVALAVTAIFGYAIFSGSTDYRLTRLLSFLDPQKYYNSAGYQILNSQMSIGSGGMYGRGMFVVGSISQLESQAARPGTKKTKK